MTKQEAIALVREVSNYMATRPEIDEAIDMAIEALEQEPKRGKWIQAKDIEKEYAVCTNCKHHGEFYMDYCPNCGSYNGGDER